MAIRTNLVGSGLAANRLTPRGRRVEPCRQSLQSGAVGNFREAAPESLRGGTQVPQFCPNSRTFVTFPAGQELVEGVHVNNFKCTPAAAAR